MKERFTKHGAFSWNELVTQDISAAKSFYSDLLGWTLEDMPMPDTPDTTYTVIKAGEEQIGGMMAIPPQMQGAPSHWGAYVTVEDVDAIAKKAEELGAKTIVPPTDIPQTGRFYMFQDPQGATLAVITYTNPEQ